MLTTSTNTYLLQNSTGTYLLMVVEDPNAGFIHAVLAPKKAKDSYEIIFTSHSNLNNLTAYTSVIKTTKPKASVTNVTGVITKRLDAFTAYLGLKTISDFQTDCRRVSLLDYLNKHFTLSESMVVVDASTSTYRNKKRVFQTETYWAALAHDPKFKSPMTDDDLYNRVISTPIFKEVKTFIEHENPLDKFKNILLVGEKGGGKSTLVDAYARYLDMPYASLGCAEKTEVDDLSGVMNARVVAGNLLWEEKFTELLMVAQAGGIVFLDEINNAQSDLHIALNQFIYGDRSITWRGTKFRIHPDTIFFFAMNEGYEGNKEMNAAFESRCRPFNVPALSREDMESYITSKFGVASKAFLDAFFGFYYATAERVRTVALPMDTAHSEGPIWDSRAAYRMFGELFNDGVTVRDCIKSTLKGVMREPIFNADFIQQFMTAVNDKIVALENTIDTAFQAFDNSWFTAVPLNDTVLQASEVKAPEPTPEPAPASNDPAAILRARFERAKGGQ